MNKNLKKLTRKKILVVACFMSIIVSTNAQSSYNGGLLQHSATDYANLPTANWDTMKKYAPVPPPPPGTASRPSSIILNTPPIGSQGGSGTCVGWAVGYTAMSMLQYPKYKNCWKYALRSPNYIYNQLNTNCSGPSAGAWISGALDLVKAQGVCSYDLMPFNSTNCSIQPNTTQTNEASSNKALDWGTVNRTSVTSFKDVIEMGYPIVIGIYTNSNWYTSVTTNPGIWSSFVPNSDGTSGAHAVCIIGYDDAKNAFKVQDQSGVGGRYDNGFWWITYDMVQGGQAIFEAYVMYPKSTNPPPPSIQAPPRPTITVSNTTNATKKNVTIVFPASTSDRIFSYILSATGSTGATGTGAKTWTKIMTNGDIVTFGQRATSTCGSYLSPDDNGVSYKLVNGDLVENELNRGVNETEGNENDLIANGPDDNGIATTVSVLKNKIDLYPNPVKDMLNIRISQDNSTDETTNFIISDLSGRHVKTLKITSSFTTVSIADLPNGIYYVKMFNNIESSIKKIVIRK